MTSTQWHAQQLQRPRSLRSLHGAHLWRHIAEQLHHHAPSCSQA